VVRNREIAAPAGRLKVARRFSGGAKWEKYPSAVGTIEVLTHPLQAVRKYRKKEYGFTGC
jgi:hypothetical protein